jgi:hypothetical protein
LDVEASHMSPLPDSLVLVIKDAHDTDMNDRPYAA